MSYGNVPLDEAYGVLEWMRVSGGYEKQAKAIEVAGTILGYIHYKLYEQPYAEIGLDGILEATGLDGDDWAEAKEEWEKDRERLREPQLEPLLFFVKIKLKKN